MEQVVLNNTIDLHSFTLSINYKAGARLKQGIASVRNYLQQRFGSDNSWLNTTILSQYTVIWFGCLDSFIRHAINSLHEYFQKSIK